MSKAVSAQYLVACPTCGAMPKYPCRTLTTKRITDTHLSRIDAAYPTVTAKAPLLTSRVGEWGSD